MRFSAGDEAPRWAVNERRFRKRHLPHLVDAGSCPCWWCCLLALCELSWRAVIMACAKRQNLPFAAKLEIINRVERGEKKSDVAAAYKIPRSALSTILKNKADIRAK
ncbi:hypothetical protein HPB50_009938 [Hyalomma asiaticum]|uniref:Uncharacterized protein n=1 Tax=Hyalomma asiaticum TaxID=266040 RepID=A0ACB7SCD5_HYAAI|nr:hypothetical protein HPB50_009938 [Hyalomma asiaticum]